MIFYIIFSKVMTDYTLSSYEEALKIYDQNAENLKDRYSKEIEELEDVFNKTQEDVKNDQFLLWTERARMLRKRKEWFIKIQKEKEKQLKADLDAENEHKDEFVLQNGWFDYHCFVILTEISKAKEEKLWEVNQELVKKQEELARLKAEIEAKEQEANDLKWDLASIQTETLHEAFFEFDVMPRIKKVESDLTTLVEENKNDYAFPEGFVSRTVRCLTKECKKQKESLNYEWWQLKLSFNTVERRTEWESSKLKDRVISILRDWGFLVEKMEIKKPDLKAENMDIDISSITFTPIIRIHDNDVPNKQYLKDRLSHLEKDDIQWRMEIFKQLLFSFANESAFIKQVETARSEWVDLIEDIDRWLQVYIDTRGGISPRTSDDKREFLKISLGCNLKNPRILMTMDPIEWMKILCVAPHIDYDNILRGQTTNYFQTWKWDWTKKWKQWRKTWRA